MLVIPDSDLFSIQHDESVSSSRLAATLGRIYTRIKMLHYLQRKELMIFSLA